MTPRRAHPHLELVAVDGNPTEAERAAAKRTLQRLVEAQRRARTRSFSGAVRTAPGLRLGTLDLVGRLDAADLWRLSGRLPWTGREYPGRAGRGDAR